MLLILFTETESCHDANVVVTGGTGAAIMTNYGAASDFKVGIMTIIGFQCLRSILRQRSLTLFAGLASSRHLSAAEDTRRLYIPGQQMKVRILSCPTATVKYVAQY